MEMKMSHEMVKYRRYLTIGYQSRMEHRFSVFCSIAVFMFPLVAKIVFWKAVYAGGDGSIADFDMSDMILYLLVFQFVFEFTWAYPGTQQVRPAIISGGLTSFLLRPANYILTVFIRDTGNMFPRWTSTIGIFVFFLIVFWNDIHLPSEGWIYPAGVVSTALCYLLTFFYSFLLGLFAFWTESDIPFLDHIRRFFSGWIVPLAFFPGWVKKLADILPYKYMIYFPTTILMGKVSFGEFVIGTVLQLVWIAFFLLVIQFVWQRGIGRYNAYGG